MPKQVHCVPVISQLAEKGRPTRSPMGQQGLGAAGD